MRLSETPLAIRNVLKKKNMGKLHIVFRCGLCVISDTWDPLRWNFHMKSRVTHGIGKFKENQSVSSFMCIYVHSGFRESWENYNHRIKTWMRYQINKFHEQTPIMLQEQFTLFSKQTYNLNSRRKEGAKFTQSKNNFRGLFSARFLGKENPKTKKKNKAKL